MTKIQKNRYPGLLLKIMGKTKSVLLKTSGDFLKIELGRKNDKN
jgi:hypothetical protein